MAAVQTGLARADDVIAHQIATDPCRRGARTVLVLTVDITVNPLRLLPLAFLVAFGNEEVGGSIPLVSLKKGL